VRGLECLIVAPVSRRNLAKSRAASNSRYLSTTIQRQITDFVGRQGAQLSAPALLRVTRANPNRIKILDMAEGDLQFFDLDFVFRRQVSQSSASGADR
jgi:hypothetical protein